MVKQLELRRHTDNDGDVLTDEGVRHALEVGRRLHDRYEVVVSTGAQRATQTAACFLAAGCQGVDRGVVVERGLRSDHEDRWKEAYQEAGGGALSDFKRVAADFVEQEAKVLGDALRRVLDSLDDGGRALIVGHSPTNEAAVYGLTGQELEPVSKGAGVLVVVDGDRYEVSALE
ncbi:MAG: histidine phosphatase family protein [Actinobacteria bacterium]|nr:histidine phosphatase family protein [Actinomycetota bacterium]